MSGNLVGYDMVVAITQNEVNSQFQRLQQANPPVIHDRIIANGLSKSGGVFGGGSLQLSSYIRGYIDAPQVQFATLNSPLQVLFYFDFKSHPVTAADLGVTDKEFQAAFANSPDGKNGLLVKKEDIPYHDGSSQSQVLDHQLVYYWLTRKKIGTIASYALAPALYYLDSGNNQTMVLVDGLRLSFQVLLSKIPTTPKDIEDAVAKGIMTSDVLTAITNNKFNASVFSLEQLFLNFDNTNFDLWELNDPAKALGAEVTGMSISSPNSYQVLTAPLEQLTKNDPSFSKELSTNLEYTFGVKGDNTAGRNPYLVGISVTSTDPAKTNPNQPPSLVPTYIGYSTTPNPNDQGLSTIAYQILCGADGPKRVPKNNDQTTRNISTNFIQNNDYSGELLFDRSVFFDPLLLTKIQSALNTGAAWTQNGRVWSSNYTKDTTLNDEDNTVSAAGFIVGGTKQKVTQTEDNTYTINVASNKISISGSLKKTVTIKVQLYAVDIETTYKWWKDGTLDWSYEIEMYLDTNQQLLFKSTSNIPPPTVSDTHTDLGADIVDVISSIFKTLSAGYFPTIEDTMSKIGQGISTELAGHAGNLNRNLAQGVKNNFISPTGKVFFLNDPRFNDEFDLQMDVTYRV